MTSPNDAEQRKIMEECLILLAALVLTEPYTNRRQQAMISKLILRLRKALK